MNNAGIKTVKRKENEIATKPRFRYSPEADVLVVVLRDGEPKYGGEIAPGVIVHYDVDGQPIEVEILDGGEFLATAIREVLKTVRRTAEAANP